MSDDNKALSDGFTTLISERKRDYRNKVLLGNIYCLYFLLLIFVTPVIKNMSFSQPHIALIEVNGLISSETQSSADKGVYHIT